MKILVLLADLERDRQLADLAVAIAGDGEVTLASVIEVGAGRSLATEQPQVRARRRELDVIASAVRGGARPPRTVVTVARRGWDAVLEAVGRGSPDLLLIGWRRAGWDILGTTLDEIVRDPPCDVAVVRGSLARARRLLVPIRGGRYAQLAVSLAVGFARRRNGAVTLLHVREPGRRSTLGIYRSVGDLAFDERVEQLVSRSGDPAAVIAEELERHDAIVFGATAREGANDQLGPVGAAIMRGGKPALIVRTRTPVASSIFLPRPELPADRTERSRVIGELVDRWFAENTFASTEFADLRKLVDAKERQGLRVSVGLPALNEEATIGKIIRAIRSRLMERFPLVDELVVIDSDSSDRTREVAEAEGVPVHVHQRVLPELGGHPGKGEALWKSLYLLSGDLVVWVDTDVTGFHPKFVYGILGPLLLRPEIQFVKAFYQRPLHVGTEVQATGGGRVTELTARPILNLFFPELSGMVQPLSGEQGGRRELLEQLPFFGHYGVETGLLIDTLQRVGLEGIAQVDMRQRIHRNQSLYALSQMAFQILQVAMKRIGEARGERLWEDANSTMKLIRPARGGLHLEVHDIAAVERPPMITVPAYRAKRGL
ncbi:MAG: glucosyl-3-phosphoglycerate synthase [Chloroflexota bacterium]|nr:glucosyl-3-phosphoglycerate synthase [Chloroflexota bacterium]MDE3193431.1 glucosyl-3-phosphoglycerate synthase [Chloroflexota bacterium]